MKKGVQTRKLSRTTNERKRLFRGLTGSLTQKGFVVTTIAKAKAVKPLVEKLITKAKSDSLATLRMLTAETGDYETARNLMVVGKAFKSRPGGYTRILRLGQRQGDNTQEVRLEWSEKIVMPEPVTSPSAKKDLQSTKSESNPKPERTVGKSAKRKSI